MNVSLDRSESSDATQTTDEYLLDQVVAGDESAMTELYERHAAFCRKRAFNVLRDAALAEDATQEAFVDLWRTAAKFDPNRAPVRAWLCVLVHRRAVDIARREARRLEEAEDSTAIDRASYTAEEMVILRFERTQMQQAVKKLPIRQREVLELTYYGGFSQSQLATRLGVPLGTIKSRIHTAIRLLAANLAA